MDKIFWGIIITALVTFIILLLFVIALLILLLKKAKIEAKIIGIEVVRFIIVAIFLMGPVALALAAGKFNNPQILPWTIIITTPLIFIFVVLIRKFTRPDNWVDKFWNWEKKSFSGVIVADYANTLGVLGGLGAYRLIDADSILKPVWWWIGIYGAILAIIVGFATFGRWWNLQENRKDISLLLVSVTNFLVGICVYLSLTFSENKPPGTLEGNLLLVFLSEVFIGGLISTITDDDPHETDEKKIKLTEKKIKLALMVSAFWIIFILVTSYFYIFDIESTLISMILGIAGIVIWVVTELLNCVPLVYSWRHEVWPSVYDYLGFEKSAGQIVGGVSTILFLIWEWEALFIAGAILSILGTLRGIARGFLNRSWKLETRRRQEERRIIEPLIPLGARQQMRQLEDQRVRREQGLDLLDAVAGTIEN